MPVSTSRTMKAFPPNAVRKLGVYVYRLVDPRNGETFYVGKGKGNRVFAHIRAEPDLTGDEVDNKLGRIRGIQLAGLEVAHIIHRHGMTDAIATEVEAALIDAYPGLTNVMGGTGSNDYGPMHASEVLARYNAQEASFQHRALLINVNTSASERPLYEATRFAWRISRKRAREAEIVLAVRKGLIVGAFVPEKWLPATAHNFPGRETVRGRLGFVGAEAPVSIARRYIHKRVPDSYRKRGAANPIRYTWRA